jgi:serine/threonine-protein kinase
MSPPKPPLGNSTGRTETCPLCGKVYDAGKGHSCEEKTPVELVAEEANEEEQNNPTSAIPQVGEVLAGRYEILQELSRGGMGIVYKARHKVLNNIVAVKVLLKPGDETDQKRFLQEAQLASKVAHPNTIYISDFGVLPDGKSFLVMEYMEGPTLTGLLRKQPKRQLDIVRACKIAVQIANGMQTVHDKGIVHREAYRKTKLCFQTPHPCGQRRRQGPCILTAAPRQPLALTLPRFLRYVP